MGGRGLPWSSSGLGTVAGCCEHGNEHLGFVKYGEFLEYFSIINLSRNSLPLEEQVNWDV